MIGTAYFKNKLRLPKQKGAVNTVTMEKTMLSNST